MEYPIKTKKVLIFDSYDDVAYTKRAWEFNEEAHIFDIRIIETKKQENVIKEYNDILKEYGHPRPKIYSLKKNIPQQLSGKIIALTVMELCDMFDDDNV